MPRLRQTLVACCALSIAAPTLAVAAPGVTAVLSNSEAYVGEVVQLEIRVTDAGSAAVPVEIAVDGLEIHQTGTSRQIEMRNFTASSSTTYNYTVLPLKAGTYKIPAQTVQVGGSSLRTPELTLRVNAAPGGQSSAGAGGAATANSGRLAFAELIVPKKTAYVGEMIPVVVRLCFATRARLTDLPEITAQGFTTQKLQVPDQPTQETINGKEWEVFTFKTAISPTRAGKFEIGPVRASGLVSVPRRHGTSRGRSPFDMFDDPFLSDPFFRDPFGNLTQQQRVPVLSEPVTLEVKPLPPNAPPSFAGAVGNFTMVAEAKPKTVQVGDPITLTATISGRGNFDRMNAPVLEDENGWHKYPPSSKFKQDDEVGISGQKTFESVISPNEKKSAVPALAFSYFDPVKQQYVTLRSDPMPVRIEGGSAATAAASPASAGAPVTSAAPAANSASSPTASPPPRDILYQLTDQPAQTQSFKPLFADGRFWLAQLLPLLALTAFIGWNLRAAHLRNRDAHTIAALQHELADLGRQLRRSDLPPNQLFPQASRFVQVKTALAGNINPSTVDAETAARVFKLDESERAQLRKIFEQSDELRYSGAANGHTSVSQDQQRAVFRFVEGLRT
ncbi:MAG: BatD family protein [Chthoniobacterales bacterium]